MASSVAAMASFRWAEAIVITTDASPTGTVPTLKADLTVFPDYLPMHDDNPLQRGIRVPQLGTQLPQLLVGHVVVGLIIQADDCPSVEGVSRRPHKDRLRATGGAEEGRSAFSSSELPIHNLQRLLHVQAVRGNPENVVSELVDEGVYHLGSRLVTVAADIQKRESAVSTGHSQCLFLMFHINRPDDLFKIAGKIWWVIGSLIPAAVTCLL